MKILIAGASGLIGAEVLRLLKQAGHSVRTLSRDENRAAALRHLTDDVRIADATVEGALRAVCDDIEVVVSAIGAAVSPGGKGSRSFHDVDVRANRALLAEAKSAGVRRFVYVSVFATPSYAATRYVHAHQVVEQELQASGLEFGIVRPTGVFGALSEFVSMARKGPVPLIGDGAATSNPVHELDVAEAVVNAVTNCEQRVEIDIGGPETLSRKRIGELAFAAVGKPSRLIAMPVWLMRVIAFVYGITNRRMGDFLQFVILASTSECVAPVRGTRSLAAYFDAFARQRP